MKKGANLEQLNDANMYQEWLDELIDLELGSIRSFFDLFAEVGTERRTVKTDDVFTVGHALMDKAEDQIKAALDMIAKDIGAIRLQGNGDTLLKATLEPTRMFSEHNKLLLEIKALIEKGGEPAVIVDGIKDILKSMSF